MAKKLTKTFICENAQVNTECNLDFDSPNNSKIKQLVERKNEQRLSVQELYYS